MHVNLIYDTELRSTSPVSLSLAIKLAAGSIIFLLLLGAFSVWTAFYTLQTDVAKAREEWRRTEPRHQAAIKLRTDLAVQNAILKQIVGWRHTCMDWGEQLDRLQAVVPAEVQLTDLRLSQVILITSNNVPARVYELRLTGRAGSAGSEENISQLKQSLANAPFDRVIESVTIPPGSFRQDPAAKTSRVFELVGKYGARRFE